MDNFTFAPLRDAPGYEFAAFKNPGFVCAVDHPQCVGKPSGQQHGVHGDEWMYIVRSGDFALALTVYTDDYRDGKLPGYPFSWRDGPEGADLSLHAPFPTYDESPNKCGFVRSGSCFRAWSGALVARNFWRDWSDRERFEQRDMFWGGLRIRLDELTKHAQATGATPQAETP